MLARLRYNLTLPIATLSDGGESSVGAVWMWPQLWGAAWRWAPCGMQPGDESRGHAAVDDGSDDDPPEGSGSQGIH